MSKWLMQHEDHLDSRFHVTCQNDDGVEYWVPIRPIFIYRGLVVHRPLDRGHGYCISHLHTGKLAAPPFKRLWVAFEFMRAMAEVFDFEGYKAGEPTRTKHQQWQLNHIIYEAKRAYSEGWYQPPEKWVTV